LNFISIRHSQTFCVRLCASIGVDCAFTLACENEV
jgi:predicted small metal-binding protein